MVSQKSGPVLVDKEPQLMAVITTKGDPNVVMEKAMAALYGAVYGLKFQLKKQGVDFTVGKLICRWPDAHLVPKDQWTGNWGLPVPPGTSELPQKISEFPVRLELWEYGTVAEILHIGPYTEEEPTVQQLHSFISDSGFEISGIHEEEYLTKPTSKVIKTVIRYPVKPRS